LFLCFFFFSFCAVMSILSFKLDFYMFVLSLYITYISLQTIFYLVSTVVPYCTFCRVIYKYIYARLPLLKKKQTPTVLLLLMLSFLYSSVLPAIIYYYYYYYSVLFVSLHIFVCNMENICKYRRKKKLLHKIDLFK